MPRRDPNDPFELDSTDLERLLVRVRAAPATSGPPILVRLREFQKRLFPKPKAGRGKRALYDMRETLRLVLAFELVDLDLSSPRCINVVEDNGRAIDRLMLAAWQARRMADAGMATPGELAAERGRLTMRIALSAATHELGAYALFATNDAPPPDGWPGRRARIEVDMLMLVADVVAALEGEAFRYLPREIDEAFLHMGKLVYASRDPNRWSMPVAKPNDQRVLRS